MCTELLLRRRPFVELRSKTLSQPLTAGRQSMTRFFLCPPRCGTTVELLEHFVDLIPRKFQFIIDQVPFNNAKVAY
jgi:hypothetical protein